jgi:RNA polymerase sigma-70 factor (ECF subfamily)
LTSLSFETDKLSLLENAIRNDLPRMLATANRILRDDAEARDAVQDGCVLAFRKLEHYTGEGEIQGWLRRIVINAALGRLRKRKQLREGQIDDLMPEYDKFGILLGSTDTGFSTPEDLLARSELQKATREAIDSLPSQPRVLLILRDIEGLTTKETAEQLEISEAAVKTGLHRARLALKTLLSPRFAEDFK